MLIWTPYAFASLNHEAEKQVLNLQLFLQLEMILNRILDNNTMAKAPRKVLLFRLKKTIIPRRHVLSYLCCSFYLEHENDI